MEKIVFEPIQVAKLYVWNGSPTASFTEALSKAKLSEATGLYFFQGGPYNPILAVGMNGPVDGRSDRHARKIYSDQRRVTLPSQMIEPEFDITMTELKENPIKIIVYASQGILKFERAGNSISNFNFESELEGGNITHTPKEIIQKSEERVINDIEKTAPIELEELANYIGTSKFDLRDIIEKLEEENKIETKGNRRNPTIKIKN